MGAIVNGIVLHGPTRAFGGTFLIFSDYMRPSVRIAALMNIPSIYVWTHDSVALGEDGPTHQPIEQLATLRAIPNFTVVRPADANETSVVWLELLRRHAGPAGLALTRQNIPVFARGEGEASGDVFASADNAAKGAYILAEAPDGTPDVILIGTGSEVQLAVAARETLAAEGINARVVSAPSLEWFAEQDDAYRECGAAGIRHRPRVGRGRPRASPGAASSATTAAPCRSSTSARPPTTRPCSRSSASPPTPSSRRPARPSPPRSGGSTRRRHS